MYFRNVVAQIDCHEVYKRSSSLPLWIRSTSSSSHPAYLPSPNMASSSQPSSPSTDLPMRLSTEPPSQPAEYEAPNPRTWDDVSHIEHQLKAEFKRLGLNPKPHFVLQSDIWRDAVQGRKRWCCYIKVLGLCFGGS